MGLGFLVCEWIPNSEDGIVISGFFNNTNERILHTLIRFVTSSAKIGIRIVVVSNIVHECAFSLAATSVPFLDPGRHHKTHILSKCRKLLVGYYILTSFLDMQGT